jgi:hypothetical protein
MYTKTEIQNKINQKRGFLLPGYINKKIERGYISNKKVETFIQHVTEVLELVYPGLWDIHFKLEENSRSSRIKYCFTELQIIIKYPEFTIINSQRQSTIIKDLYVKIPVRISDLAFQTIEGARGCRTMAENHVNYSHSHLKATNNPTYFDTFCTGSGEINMITPMLTAEFNKDLFQLYLLHLENFVSWESLEGTPYINLSSMTEGNFYLSQSSVNFNTCIALLTSLRLEIRQNRDLANKITWKISDGMYKIQDNESLQDLYRVLKRNNLSQFGVKNSAGDVVAVAQIRSASQINSRVSPILFKGEFIPFKFIDDENINLSTVQMYLNPVINKYIIKTLENECNKKAIANSVFGK